MIHNGSCLCGVVKFKIAGDLTPPDACHCQQCRKQSGHFWASTDIAEDRITILGDKYLTWYQASEKVRRGFCKSCGSFLFWDPLYHPYISVAMGAFEKTNTRLHKHIYTANKGDYYEISDKILQE